MALSAQPVPPEDGGCAADAAHAGEKGLLTTEVGSPLDVEDMASRLGAFGKRVSTRYGMASRLLMRKRESVNGK